MQSSPRDGAIALRWWFEPHDPTIRVRIVDGPGKVSGLDASADDGAEAGSHAGSVVHGVQAVLDAVGDRLDRLEQLARLDLTARPDRDADATGDRHEP